MFAPQAADFLIAGLILGGILVAGIIVFRYIRRSMSREDWADAGSFDGPRRMRFMRAHGERLLILLAILFVWFLIVGLALIPMIEGLTQPRG